MGNEVMMPEEYLQQGRFYGLSWAEQVRALKRLGTLRTILLTTGRNLGAGLDDAVSDEFLAHLPAEAEALQTALKAAQDEQQRAMDLVRYASSYLHEEKLISDDEFATLVADSENGQRVTWLEGYDRLMENQEALKAKLQTADGLLVRYRNNTMDGDVHEDCRIKHTREGVEVDCRCNICRDTDAHVAPSGDTKGSHGDDLDS
jgi:hypothetical protein